MADPMVAMHIVTSAASTLNALLELAVFVNKVRTCPDDVAACFKLVKCVSDDIEYAVSLRTKNRIVLDQRPYEARRIDSIIETAIDSLEDIARLVERCRPGAHGGKVPMMERLKWILRDSNSFVLRSRNLQAQHAAITGEISYLRQLILLEPIATAAATTTFENLDLLKAKSSVLDIRDGKS